jgi:hypothetical protein
VRIRLAVLVARRLAQPRSEHASMLVSHARESDGRPVEEVVEAVVHHLAARPERIAEAWQRHLELNDVRAAIHRSEHLLDEDASAAEVRGEAAMWCAIDHLVDVETHRNPIDAPPVLATNAG